jgi:ubiquitin-protein ligase
LLVEQLQELKEFQTDAPDWCGASLAPGQDSLFKWKAWIEGPVCLFVPIFAKAIIVLTFLKPDTPFEKGKFQLELDLPNEYPFKPPKVWLIFSFLVVLYIRLTCIYSGEILNKNLSPKCMLLIPLICYVKSLTEHVRSNLMGQFAMKF